MITFFDKKSIFYNARSPFSWFCRPLQLQFPNVLRFFRNSQFFVAIPLALYIIVVHTGALSGAIQPPSTGQEGGLAFQKFFGWAIQEASISAMVAIVLIFIQAVIINFLADEFRLLGERNWFPGLFYALTASAIPDFLFVTAPLVAATFIPLSIWNILKAYQKPNVTEAIFDGALWIAVASLFYPPALFLLIAAFAGFTVVRAFRISEQFVFLLGVLVPLFLAWLGYFWTDQGGEFRDRQWGNLMQFHRFEGSPNLQTGLNVGIIAILLLVLVIGMGAQNSRKGIQNQKSVGVFFWFMLIGGLSILLRVEWHWDHLLLMSAAMALLLSLAFQNFRTRLLAELWHLGILSIVLIVQFFDFFLKLFDAVF